VENDEIFFMIWCLNGINEYAYLTGAFETSGKKAVLIGIYKQAGKLPTVEFHVMY